METAELLAKQPISLRLAKSRANYDPNRTKTLRKTEEIVELCGGRLESIGQTIRDLRRPPYYMDIDFDAVTREWTNRKVIQ